MNIVLDKVGRKLDRFQYTQIGRQKIMLVPKQANGSIKNDRGPKTDGRRKK